MHAFRGFRQGVNKGRVGVSAFPRGQEIIERQAILAAPIHLLLCQIPLKQVCHLILKVTS